MLMSDVLKNTNFNTRLGAFEDLHKSYSEELEMLKRKMDKEEAKSLDLKQKYFDDITSAEAKATYEFYDMQFRLTQVRYETMREVVAGLGGRIGGLKDMNF